jgi:hypothetical protein
MSLTLLHNLFVQAVSCLEPSITIRTWQTSFLGETKTAVESHPKHDLGVREPPFVVANLPDGHIWLCLDMSHILHSISTLLSVSTYGV